MRRLEDKVLDLQTRSGQAQKDVHACRAELRERASYEAKERGKQAKARYVVYDQTEPAAAEAGVVVDSAAAAPQVEAAPASVAAVTETETETEMRVETTSSRPGTAIASSSSGSAGRYVPRYSRSSNGSPARDTASRRGSGAEEGTAAAAAPAPAASREVGGSARGPSPGRYTRQLRTTIQQEQQSQTPRLEAGGAPPVRPAPTSAPSAAPPAAEEGTPPAAAPAAAPAASPKRATSISSGSGSPSRSTSSGSLKDRAPSLKAAGLAVVAAQGLKGKAPALPGRDAKTKPGRVALSSGSRAQQSAVYKPNVSARRPAAAIRTGSPSTE